MSEFTASFLYLRLLLAICEDILQRWLGSSYTSIEDAETRLSLEVLIPLFNLCVYLKVYNKNTCKYSALCIGKPMSSIFY